MYKSDWIVVGGTEFFSGLKAFGVLKHNDLANRVFRKIRLLFEMDKLDTELLTTYRQYS